MNKATNPKKILVCGGTGFIGRKLVDRLQQQGRVVNLLVHDKISKPFKKNSVVIFKGDLLDKKTLIKAVENSNIILNLVSTFDDDACYLFNIASSANLLAACKDNKNIEKIIFISSGAVYGNYKSKPYKETDSLKPVTTYGLSKYLAEETHKFYSKKYNIPVIILRLAYTYGPEQEIGVISEFLSFAFKNQPIKMHKNGKQARDFLYVDDAVSGIIKSIDYRSKGFDVFNISGKKAYSLLETIALIEKNIGRKIKIEFMPAKKYDMKYMCASYRKAKFAMGYEPKVSLNQGIARTIAYLIETTNNFSDNL